MSKLTPVRAPAGYDPTREEFQLQGPSCRRLLMIGFGLIVIGVLGAYFFLSRLPASASPTLPTVAHVPTSTQTKRPTATSAQTATIRAYLTSLPPMPSETLTFTPSMTFTASPGPSATRTNTATRTPTRTPKPLPTRRPRSSVGQPAAQGGSDSIPQEPIQGNPPIIYREITVWAPPIRATCCKPLEPAQTWTPGPTSIPPTADNTVVPSDSPTPIPSTIPTQVPTITSTQQPSPTPIQATATPLPSSTPILPSDTPTTTSSPQPSPTPISAEGTESKS